MKKKLIGLVVVVLMFGRIVGANATLIDQSNGVIFDDVANQYWFQNMIHQTYDQQIAGISELNTAGSGYISPFWGDWRMADTVDMMNLWEYTGSELVVFNFSQMHIPTGSSATIGYVRARYNNESIDGYHFVAGLNIPLIIAGYPGVEVYPILPEKTVLSQYAAPDSDFVDAWIVADGSFSFIPTPVPEPATILLFSVGVACLAGIRLRKKPSVPDYTS